MELKKNQLRANFGIRPQEFFRPSDLGIRDSGAGAGGGTRTHTAFYGPRVLSPVRLPFRHTGSVECKHWQMPRAGASSRLQRDHFDSGDNLDSAGGNVN